MKYLFLSLTLLFGLCCNAQEITTHSNYDVDADGNVTISDVTSTISTYLGDGNETQVVDAAVLNKVLLGIYSKLTELETIKKDLLETKQRLQCIEKAGLYAYPFENCHEYVDLGLSVKWATMNVGATSPESAGDYFAWGETKPKENYDTEWRTYFDTNDGGATFIKYNIDGGKTVLDLEDDAAHVNWGGSWRMPTKAEQDELRDNCEATWVTQNNVNGLLLVSKINQKSIFLPAVGGISWDAVGGEGTDGRYLSNTLTSYLSTAAYLIHFNSSGITIFDGNSRSFGYPVRAVCP